MDGEKRASKAIGARCTSLGLSVACEHWSSAVTPFQNKHCQISSSQLRSVEVQVPFEVIREVEVVKEIIVEKQSDQTLRLQETLSKIRSQVIEKDLKT